MNKDTEMYHAAINILSNRADQLGLDDDELMHYGRKGMKWNQNIFEDQYKSRHGANSVGGHRDNNPMTTKQRQADAENELARAQLAKEIERRRREEPNFAKAIDAQYRTQQIGTARPDKDYGRQVREQQRVQRNTDRINNIQNDYAVNKAMDSAYKDNDAHNYLPDNYKLRGENVREHQRLDRQLEDDIASTNRARQEEMLSRAEYERQAREGNGPDSEEALRTVKEGRANSANVSDDYTYNPEYERIENIAKGKSDLHKKKYEYLDNANAEREARTQGAAVDAYKKARQADAEKYGNTGNEFNDEDRAKGQEVRMKQRGRAVREAQKQQRQEELNAKKNLLLNRARLERYHREGY